MPSRMRLLIVAVERPFPPLAGADLRNWQNLTAAATAAEVGLVYLTAAAGPEVPAPQLPATGRPPALWQRLDPRPPAAVWRAGAPRTPLDLDLTAASLAGFERALASFRPDTVLLSHTHLYPLAGRVKAAGLRLIVDMHNLESHLYRRLVPRRRLLKWLGRRLLETGPRRIAAVERRLMAEADQIWLCSAEDRARLLQLGPPRAALQLVPNGLPPGRFQAAAPRAAPPAGRPPTLLFLGQLAYTPNGEAARYLIRLLPRLRRRWPGLRLLLAGRTPGPRLVERARAAGAELLADPPDTAPLLRAADIMLVPLFAGGGTRLKVPEALAAGLPVVATRLAVEGLGLEAGREVLLAERAAEFERQIARLLEQPGLYAAMSAAGLAVVAARFAPERVAPQVEASLRALKCG